MDAVRDSLLRVDPNAYNQLLHDRMIMKQYTRMAEKKREMEKVLAKKDELKPLVEDYTAMKELEELPMERWIEGMNPEESLALTRKLGAGLLGKLNSLLQRIETFQLGNTSPSYTASSMDAVVVAGVNAEVRFGKLMLGGTAGSIQPSPFIGNGLPWSAALQPGGKQVLAGKVGLGNEETFLQVFGMNINLPVNADSNASLRGQVSNRIVGLQSGLSLLKQRIRIQGDWQYAVLEGGALLRDSRGLPLSWEEPLDIDQQSMSSGMCWNMELQASILDNLQVEGSYRNLSEGYVSLGTPFMSRSAARYRANLRYQMAKGKLITTVFMRRDEDPATAFKLGQSLSTQYGTSLTYRPSEKLPWIQVQYIPFSQNHQNQEESQSINGSLLAGTMGSNFRINNLWFQSSASVTANTTQSLDQAAASDSRLYTFRQACQIGEHGGFAASYTRVGAAYSQDVQQTNALDVSGFAVIGKAFRTDLGISWVDERGAQGLGRKSIYLISQCPLSKKLMLDFRAERNMLENAGLGLPNMNEYLIRSGCTLNF
jgi:hypothetical protein